jgi:ubiquinone/menaquinone biosynthesis C-methylase UbiE
VSNLYTSKAEYYAKYRWDYAQAAIAAVLNTVGISSQTVLADIGAGTGMLAKHFVDRVKMVHAIEPELEMRALAEEAFSGISTCQVLDASAEATTLPSASVDLITVGQAIHWFNPEAARKEFLRILKPSGWLAVLRNHGTDIRYEQEVGTLFEKFSKPGPSRLISHPAMSFYYGNDDFQKLLFPFDFSLTWEQFLGSLLSSAWIPDEDSPAFDEFKLAAREVFASLSAAGIVTSSGETELFLGRVTP